MAEGDIVADGPTAEVMVASPAFAPQIAKILAPLAVPDGEQVRLAAGRWRQSAMGGRLRDAGGRGAPSGSASRSAMVVVLAAFLGVRGLLLAVRRRARHLRRQRHGRRSCSARCSCSCSPWCSPRSPTAASTPRPSPCSASCRRSTPPCARSAPARPASRPCSSPWCSPAGCSAPASASRSAAPRCSPRRSSPAASGRGCRTRCSAAPGSGCSPGSCRTGRRRQPRC